MIAKSGTPSGGAEATLLDTHHALNFSSPPLPSPPPFHAHRFGTKSSCIPDPEARYKDFMFAVDLLNDREDLVWDPISRCQRGTAVFLSVSLSVGVDMEQFCPLYVAAEQCSG